MDDRTDVALKAYKISIMAVEGVTDGERSSASNLFARLVTGTNWEGRTALEWYEATKKRTERLKEIMGECDEIFTPELKNRPAPESADIRPSVRRRERVNLHEATEAEVSALTNNLKKLEDLNAELLGSAATFNDWKRQDIYLSWAIGCAYKQQEAQKKSVADFPQRFRRSERQIQRYAKISTVPLATLREMASKDEEQPPTLAALEEVAVLIRDNRRKEEREKVLAAREQGKSVREAAKAAGVKTSTAQRIIDAARTQQEPENQAPQADAQEAGNTTESDDQYYTPTEEERAKVIALLEEGEGPRRIAKHVGIPWEAVHYIAAEWRATTRAATEQPDAEKTAGDRKRVYGDDVTTTEADPALFDEAVRALNGDPDAIAAIEKRRLAAQGESTDTKPPAAPAKKPEKSPGDKAETAAKAAARKRKKEEEENSFPHGLLKYVKSYPKFRAALANDPAKLQAKARESLRVWDALRPQLVADAGLDPVEAAPTVADVLTPEALRTAAALISRGSPIESAARVISKRGVVVPAEALQAALEEAGLAVVVPAAPAPQPEVIDLDIPASLRRVELEAVH